MSVFNTLSLGAKLKLAFIFIMSCTIIIAIVFSIFYFIGKMKDEAVKNMRENIEVAELIYRTKQNNVESFADGLANNKAIQVFLDFEIGNKLSSYLKEEISSKYPSYNIIIMNKDFEVITYVGMEGTSLIENTPINENFFINSLLKAEEKAITGFELIQTEERKDILSITASKPVYRNKKFIGLIIVRYLINDNKEIVYKISRLLSVSAGIFTSREIINSAGEKIDIDLKLYTQAMSEKTKYNERTSIYPGSILMQYSPIKDFTGLAVAVLGLFVSSEAYMRIITEAIITLLVIMIILLVIAVILSNKISRSIIIPVSNLLDGAHKITTGDLSYKISTEIKDEIGELSNAFDEMRISLNEKMSTIKNMNVNLENTVQERTKTISDMLGKMQKYLSPQLYEAIMGGKKEVATTKHYRKKLTVFFSDIANFTSTTEFLQPEEISNLLNSYLDKMAGIALKWGGTIDKFVGDAIMVFYGDPEFTNDKDHALRAVKMSIEMRDTMEELRKIWKTEGFKKPFHVRSGIHTGYCTIGNFGSENRMDYTIIGNTVNLAARLESAAKPDTILISQDTYSLVQNEILCKPSIKITAKGFEHQVMAYEVMREREYNLEKVNCLEIDENTISFKQNSLNVKNISLEQKKYLFKKLSTALLWLKGEYHFDKISKTWKKKATK
ncbi:MAG: HAMP domain-containing protein [Spirochaetales bacterium]|nr:HAMP domain-containing protein [Spirochaetales bacterium]